MQKRSEFDAQMTDSLNSLNDPVPAHLAIETNEMPRVYFNTSYRGSKFTVRGLHLAEAMVMPFEVTCPVWDLIFALLVLLKAPGGGKVYDDKVMRSLVISFIRSCRFDNLQHAVVASIAANEMKYA